ncbi:MAG: hypothetical protein FJZ95_10655 [Chloroflexi bacterium]|nr:hypothetical protein [Chloroflexota bacterium]
MSEAIDHLTRSISEGKHWYIALLEAIGLWQIKEETYNGQHYRYLIGKEAFNWLLLAQRLCDEAGDLIPEDEKIDLLLGKPPLRLSKGEFKALIGHAKYRAYLNYFYGVIVEQALQLAVENEAQKEQIGRIRPEDPQESAFRRIYGSSEAELLNRFRIEIGHGPSEIVMLMEFDEFTYWLFKYRLANCDSARVASDTKKALEFLAEFQADRMEF